MKIAQIVTPHKIPFRAATQIAHIGNFTVFSLQFENNFVIRHKSRTRHFLHALFKCQLMIGHCTSFCSFSSCPFFFSSSSHRLCAFLYATLYRHLLLGPFFADLQRPVEGRIMFCGLTPLTVMLSSGVNRVKDILR